MKKGKYPIPDYCKTDCYFRDKKALYMPACQYPFQLDIKENKNGERVCLTYEKEEAIE